MNFKYTYTDKTLLIRNFFILSKVQGRQDDLFNTKIPTEVTTAFEHYLESNFRNIEHYCLTCENGSTWYAANPEDNEHIYLCAIVESDHVAKCLLNFYSSPGVKVWLNDSCVLIQSNPYYSLYSTHVRLKKGINVFIFELYSRRNTEFLFRIIPICDQERKKENSALYLTSIGNLPIVVHEPYFIEGKQEYRFMFLSGGIRDYLPYIQITMKDSQQSDYSKKFQGQLNVPIVVPIPVAKEHNHRRQIIFDCLLTKKDGTTETMHVQTIAADSDVDRAKIIEDAEALAKIVDLDTRESLTAQLMLGEQMLPPKGRTKQEACFRHFEALKNQVAEIKNGNYNPKEQFLNGNRFYWMRSKLDGRLIRINVSIPTDYDPILKNYPAVIFLSLGEFGNTSSYATIPKLKERGLFFDITIRGESFGSYIGEAAFFEMYKWILEHFSVNRQRVYLCGFSAAAYAVWLLAETYPHLFAGILAGGGLPDFDLLDNVRNVPVIFLTAENDRMFENSKKELLDAIPMHANCERINIPQATHQIIRYYCSQVRILNKLMSKSNPLEPCEIIYHTYRNRHLRSYWITLHDVEKIGSVASVHAKVLSKTEIEVKVLNTTGVSVSIPSYICKRRFSIVVNKNVFCFEKCNKDKLHFKKDAYGGWSVVEKPCMPNVRCGTGLLDIYFDSMKILLPTNAPESVLATATKWARPRINSFSKSLFINYPIVSAEEHEIPLLEGNLLVIDVNQSNPVLKELDLPVVCDSKGYSYLDEYITGSYVILQCISNPYNNDSSITVISTNDEIQLSKCFFTRNLIMPSYLGGVHPYLNCSILVWDGNKYRGTYETGLPLEHIN